MANTDKNQKLEADESERLCLDDEMKDMARYKRRGVGSNCIDLELNYVSLSMQGQMDPRLRSHSVPDGSLQYDFN